MKEQKSTTKLTQQILFLTILGIIVTILFSLIKGGATVSRPRNSVVAKTWTGIPFPHSTFFLSA
ncbi:MAG: hypothetical protein SNJ64_01115 [Endomicrobiia bacterium]